MQTHRCMRFPAKKGPPSKTETGRRSLRLAKIAEQKNEDLEELLFVPYFLFQKGIGPLDWKGFFLAVSRTCDGPSADRAKNMNETLLTA